MHDLICHNCKNVFYSRVGLQSHQCISLVWTERQERMATEYKLGGDPHTQ